MAEGGIILEKEGKFLEDDAKFPCLICGQKGLTQNEMRAHIMMEHVERDISCPFCDLSGVTSNEMNLHINSAHLSEEESAQASQSNTLSAKVNDSPDSVPSHTLEAISQEIHSKSKGKDNSAADNSTADNTPSKISKGMKSTEVKNKEKASSKNLKISEDLQYDHDKSCSSNSQSNLTQSNDGLKNVQASDGVDKSHLFLEVNQPREEVGVLRLTQGFNSCHTIEGATRRGTAQNGAGFHGNQRNNPLVVPDINDNVEPDINSNIPGEFPCPMCQFSTISEADIQTHVNREHLDILSPCKGGDYEMVDDDSVPRCPLCGALMNSVDELQIHVNISHSDILSPDQPMDMQEKLYPPMRREENVEKPIRGKNGPVPPMATFDGKDEDGEMAACSRNWNERRSWQEIVTCPVCDQEFDDAAILEIHVNGHFSATNTPVVENDFALAQELGKSEYEDQEQRQFEALQTMYGMKGNSSYKKQYERTLENSFTKGDLSITEYHLRKQSMKTRDLAGMEDGHSCTKGLMELFATYYGSKPPSIANVYLASHVDHYAASYGDRGWGCGYRNFQMLLSSLAANPTYSKVLFNGKPVIPSIPKIQQLIEAAWAKGFDQQGKEQLGNKVTNTTKWIGATEIVATLFSLKVKCQLLDFHSPSGPQGTHPKLFEWIKAYFEKKEPYKLPIYLQHHGHSRTVVGIEEVREGGLRLLIFDPSTPRKQMQQYHGVVNGSNLRTIRRTLHGLKAKQYQLVAVTGVLTDQQYEENKVLRSQRIH
ncbi:zinc finger-containing ubiquitin peptidase 1-like isoform X2 [Saccostrea echinata]|uniref:zinc finger-containing ubiquitin peptidase 1-like isoform X2 n=1 Tax=Saccostrea echinata TaxID=191078 RepID=UPI002A82263B|nr:zinc finger-containing ubiquitin peptidase 1-like isoform X2 [Saccostrea echinata]